MFTIFIQFSIEDVFIFCTKSQDILDLSSRMSFHTFTQLLGKLGRCENISTFLLDILNLCKLRNFLQKRKNSSSAFEENV